MPKAAIKPSRREDATAVRATIRKLGPGLTTPTASAPLMANNDPTVSIEPPPQSDTAHARAAEPWPQNPINTVQPARDPQRQRQWFRRAKNRSAAESIHPGST
jgi:hypothetical protein